MDAGLTLVRNATKHSTPMANVARLNTLLISAPVPFPFRAMRPSPLLDTSCRDDPVSAEGAVRGWGARRCGGVPSAGEEDKAYSAAIMFDFKSMPSAFATPAP
jgi:hypothetical protein